MNEQEIRKAIIEDPEYVRYIMLSDRRAKLMRMIIKKGSINSAQLSEKWKISPQNASRQLYELFSMGYLKRADVAPETGGIEYIYKSAV
jgi:predicted transcriptional regulator